MSQPNIPDPPSPGFLRINLGSDYTDEEREFLQAIDRYKRRHRRPYPTWREVLAVLKSLGYRKPS